MLFALLIFGLIELALAVGWRPDVVGARWYQSRSTGYDYGFSSDQPRLFRFGNELRYYNTEYIDIRPFTLAARKSPREIRIFVFGTSVTQGGGAAEHAAYPAVLDSLLSDRNPEFDWRVVNLAANGFGSERILHVMQNLIVYDPDLVVVHPHGSNEFEDEVAARRRAQLHSGLNGLLLRSRLLVLLKKLEAQWLGERESPDLHAETEAEAGRDPENVARWQGMLEVNLQRISDLAELTQTPSVYVGRAERNSELFESVRGRALNDPIRDRPNYLDVAALYVRQSDTDSPTDLFRDGTHYSDHGHALVAGALYELIQPGGALFDQMWANRDLPPTE